MTNELRHHPGPGIEAEEFPGEPEVSERRQRTILGEPRPRDEDPRQIDEPAQAIDLREHREIVEGEEPVQQVAVRSEVDTGERRHRERRPDEGPEARVRSRGHGKTWDV